MKLSELQPAAGSVKKTKRVGRGHGCHVRTSGKGEKGQNSRSGGGKYPGFEGGQTPWYRRLPKFRGFKNHFRVEYLTVGLDALESCADTDAVITPEVLYKKGFIPNMDAPVKVLCNGTITKAVEVKLNKFTAASKEAIEKVGGKVEVL